MLKIARVLTLDRDQRGGMKTYCSPEGRFSPKQGQLPPDFWKDVEFKAGNGTHDGRFVQRECWILPLRA